MAVLARIISAILPEAPVSVLGMQKNIMPDLKMLSYQSFQGASASGQTNCGAAPNPIGNSLKQFL